MISEREILERCRSGQEQALGLLVDRYRIHLYSLCRKLTRDAEEADDLFQDTWFKAIRGLARFRTEEAFRPWLFAICVNLYRDRCRRRTRWGRRLPGFGSPEEHRNAMDSAAAPATAEGDLDRDLRRDAVRRAVDGLKDEQRLPLVLHYFGEFKMDEIGAMLGLPAGTVKSRLAAARRHLKEAMREQFDEGP